MTKQEYMREWYIKNREKRKIYNRYSHNRLLQSRRKLLDAAKSQPCADCGIRYDPIVMDFDHVHGIKEFTIGINWNCAIKKLLNEIAKCEVVCSNCHRMRTHKRKKFKYSGAKGAASDMDV